MPGSWRDTAVERDSDATELGVTTGGGSTYRGCLLSEGCARSQEAPQDGCCGRPRGEFCKCVSRMDRSV